MIGRQGRAVLADLMALYDERPETARRAGRLAETADDIIDGADLMRLAERELMVAARPRGALAVAGAARSVSVVTAMSPRAIDRPAVRRRSGAAARCGACREIYGGRPGLVRILPAAARVGAHLAVTGGVAVGRQPRAAGARPRLAARLSAKLGEGVLNGLAHGAGRAVRDRGVPAPAVRARCPRRLSAMSRASCSSGMARQVLPGNMSIPAIWP